MSGYDEPRLSLPRQRTGIPGLDDIALGGLPIGEVTLLAGVTGSGKSVFAAQFLAAGIVEERQPGVFVTCRERPDKLRRNVAGFGWQVAEWEAQGLWSFVDAAPYPEVGSVVVGQALDFEVFVGRVAAAVKRISVRRLAVDSLYDLFIHFGDRAEVRSGVIRLFGELERLGVTTVATISRPEDYGELTEFGVEEFVADNILVLRNALVAEGRRRTVEVLKFRGTPHRRGEFPFAITPEDGIVVVPLTVERQSGARDGRTSTGITDLDGMLHGGVFRDSVTLVTGPTGTGKTNVALAFALASAQTGEPALFVGFEEGADQLFRGMRGWGLDLPELEGQGLLTVINDRPEAASLEEHVVRIKAALDRTGARRLVLDSLSSARRIGSERTFQEFTTGLTAYLKERQVTALLTSTSPLFGVGGRSSEEHISTLSDVILLLRYVENGNGLQRGITVLKQRGSEHDTMLRRLSVATDGVRVLEPFEASTRVLTDTADAPVQP